MIKMTIRKYYDIIFYLPANYLASIGMKKLNSCNNAAVCH